MKYIFLLISLFIYTDISVANTRNGFTLNGFFIEDKVKEYSKTLCNRKCYGSIHYPYFTNSNELLFMTINNEVNDFIELYSVCNKMPDNGSKSVYTDLEEDELERSSKIYISSGAKLCKGLEEDKNIYKVDYEVPYSGTRDFFSVIWRTKKNDKIWRVDVLNFNPDTGDMIKIEKIFNLLANNMLHQVIDLSKGYLPQDIEWEEFLEKVEKREIQFYIKNDEWFLVFNSNSKFDEVLEIKIPKLLLKGDDYYDRG